jgi:hypothetical protein
MAMLGHPEKRDFWPWWLANCGWSEIAVTFGQWGQLVFSGGLILLLALRILRTRGLDRRTYLPVHIASIFGMTATAGLAAWTLVVLYSVVDPFGNFTRDPGATSHF